jgi:hypothetical protein
MGPRHQAGQDFAFSGGIEFLHERNVDQIEKEQQAEPGDAADKMQPTKQHQKVCVEVGGEGDIGQGQGSYSEILLRQRRL